MKNQKSIESSIKNAMIEAGVYTSHFDLQIEQTANTIAECQKMQSIISKEGRVVTEETKYGKKTLAHPLLGIVNQFQRTILQQLSSLGLNRLKSSDPHQNNNVLKDFLSDMES